MAYLVLEQNSLEFLGATIVMLTIAIIMVMIMVMKKENNLVNNLTVKGNPVEVHGAGDLHSGKDAFKSLEAKNNNYSL